MKFPWVLIFDLGISKERVSHNFAEFPRVKLFFSGIFKVTVRNLNISGWEVGGGGQKSMSSTPPSCLDFILEQLILPHKTLNRLFQKKNKQGGRGRLRTYFFEPPHPQNFQIFNLPLKIPAKTRLYNQKLYKIVLHPHKFKA